MKTIDTNGAHRARDISVKAMVKENDMELQIMDWLCPECGLELHKHLISTYCPVSDVDEPAEELSEHVDSPDCWCEPELNY